MSVLSFLFKQGSINITTTAVIKKLNRIFLVRKVWKFKSNYNRVYFCLTSTLIEVGLTCFIRLYSNCKGSAQEKIKRSKGIWSGSLLDFHPLQYLILECVSQSQYLSWRAILGIWLSSLQHLHWLQPPQCLFVAHEKDRNKGPATVLRTLMLDSPTVHNSPSSLCALCLLALVDFSFLTLSGFIYQRGKRTLQPKPNMAFHFIPSLLPHHLLAVVMVKNLLVSL